MSERAKITANHLSRTAIVYLRQSSPAQVEHNRESTDRQHALVNSAGPPIASSSSTRISACQAPAPSRAPIRPIGSGALYDGVSHRLVAMGLSLITDRTLCGMPARRDYLQRVCR
jgi:hypothetical protein